MSYQAWIVYESALENSRDLELNPILIRENPTGFEPGDVFEDGEGVRLAVVRIYERGENAAIDAKLDPKDTLLVVELAEDLEEPGIDTDLDDED